MRAIMPFTTAKRASYSARAMGSVRNPRRGVNRAAPIRMTGIQAKASAGRGVKRETKTRSANAPQKIFAFWCAIHLLYSKLFLCTKYLQEGIIKLMRSFFGVFLTRACLSQCKDRSKEHNKQSASKKYPKESSH